MQCILRRRPRGARAREPRPHLANQEQSLTLSVRRRTWLLRRAKFRQPDEPAPAAQGDKKRLGTTNMPNLPEARCDSFSASRTRDVPYYPFRNGFSIKPGIGLPRAALSLTTK